MNGPTDRPTVQRTKGWKDRPSYKDAWTHLKTVSLTLFSSHGTVYHVNLDFFRDFMPFPLEIRGLKTMCYGPTDGLTDRQTNRLTDGQTVI